jgi:GNAT superfamily N-acetyltransferase
MQRLAQELWAIDPAYVDSDASVGELAWIWGAQHALDSEQWTQRVWFDGDAPRAWGWIFRENLASAGAHPARLVWQVHPDRLALLNEVLDWFEAETPEELRHTSARQANCAALEALRRRGYAPADGEPFGLMNARGLDTIEDPVVPPGYRLRTLDEVGDVSRRAAVHRAAWHPSRVTEAAYADVMKTWPYRADLDLVVEAPDGALAASALCWYDPENRDGEFEPVGTHPDHLRRGLARALLLFGLQRLRELSAVRALVGCRGDAAYPVPKRVYESVGFREISREVHLKKILAPCSGS